MMRGMLRPRKGGGQRQWAGGFFFRYFFFATNDFFIKWWVPHLLVLPAVAFFHGQSLNATIAFIPGRRK